MLMPLIFEDRASALSRVPPHSGQLVKVTARSANARTCGCIASGSLDSIDFWIRGISPSYVMLMPAIFILTGSWRRKSSSSFPVNLRIGLSGSKKPDAL